MTFNGYSPTGDVTGELFYGNYCTLDDYQLLESIGFNMSGKIALCRYGGNFRGLKAMIGELFGVIGLLIYSDPIDDGFSLGSVYPDGPWRPLDGVQRGSADFLSIFGGDPLTPGQPAINTTQRRYNPNNSPVLPQIPMQPLSALDALPFLQALGGMPVTANASFAKWQGGFTNITYHIGSPTTSNNSVRVRINNVMNITIAPIYNVIATINGAMEPDRQVIMGNHPRRVGIRCR